MYRCILHYMYLIWQWFYVHSVILKDDLSFCLEAKALSLLFFCFESQLHPWQPRLPPKTCQSLRPSSRGHSWLERVSNATLFWGVSVLIDSAEESRRHRLLFEEGIFARIYWWSVHRGSIWSLWNWYGFEMWSSSTFYGPTYPAQQLLPPHVVSWNWEGEIEGGKRGSKVRGGGGEGIWREAREEGGLVSSSTFPFRFNVHPLK